VRQPSGNGKGLLELLVEATGYQDENAPDNTNAKENGIQRSKLSDGRKSFTVGRIEGVYARSQEEAQAIVEKLVRLKELPESALVAIST
jgi:hypothetical protein